MIVLTCVIGERLRLHSPAVVHILAVHGRRVRLAMEAPGGMVVMRNRKYGEAGDPGHLEGACDVVEEPKPGDLVQLRSGGPVMTVARVKGEEVSCLWFNGNELKEHPFAREVLEADED